MDYPKTRKEAKAKGAKYYFTGEPCKNGHVALRKTKGACVECLKIEWQTSAAKRADVVSPATGHPDTVRNEKGHIVSVPGFVRA